MCAKQFFRKFLPILIALGIIISVGGDAYGAKKDKDAKKKPSAIPFN